MGGPRRVVLPRQGWMSALWEDCQLTLDRPRILLDGWQERVLWQETISESEQSSELLQSSGTAANVQEAWALAAGNPFRNIGSSARPLSRYLNAEVPGGHFQGQTFLEFPAPLVLLCATARRGELDRICKGTVKASNSVSPSRYRVNDNG